MTETVLLCTVGGSHQPILTAIQELAPTFVLFFATGRDQATGKPGSIETIIGKGHPVEVRCGAEVLERLPHIPTQAGLAGEQFETVEVPTDDLDQAVAVMTQATTALRARFPQAAFVADYTGGTKTMTAALVMTALEADDIQLQLITGDRADLPQVQDATTSARPAARSGSSARHSRPPHSTRGCTCSLRRYASVPPGSRTTPSPSASTS